MKRFCIVTTSLAPTEAEAVREMVARLQQRPGGMAVQGGSSTARRAMTRRP